MSDTSYPGYRDIPLDVMHGYGVMAAEIAQQLGDAPPTHVFVQAGVGALAAAVCASFWLRWERAAAALRRGRADARRLRLPEPGGRATRSWSAARSTR